MENKQVVEVEMLRRITGYLVPNINRWGDGKRAELKDRTTHLGVDYDVNSGEDSKQS